MLSDNQSFAAGQCCRISAPARQPADDRGQLYCARCDDPFVPVIRKPWSRSPRIVALQCINCNEKVPVRRGFLVTRPPLPRRLRLHLSRLFTGGAL
jgi:hypothetical protein